MFEGPLRRDSDDCEGVGRPSRRDDQSSVPEVPGPLHHRGLLRSFELVCRSFDGDASEVVASPREFSAGDVYIFNQIQAQVLDEVHGSFVYGAVRTDFQAPTPRFLHHRVVRAPSREEHHVFVEIMTSDRRSAAAAQGCFQVFSQGPVAYHYMVVDAEEVAMFPLISRPAFEETVQALRELPFGRSLTAHTNMALSWIVDSFADQSRYFRAFDGSWELSQDSVDSVMRHMRSIECFGSVSEPVFRVNYKGLNYKISMWFDPRLKRPVCFRT